MPYFAYVPTRILRDYALKSFLGFVAVFIVVFHLAGRYTRPLQQTYNKQKQFITDAGHELKTPLSIINANLDLLEEEFTDNESLQDIRIQADRLTELTNDLVCLARIEESGDSLQKILFPVSELAEDTTLSFKALAEQQNKSFTYTIEPLISMNGNSKAIDRLLNIILDNAMKYSPENGKIELKLIKKGKQILLTVYNTTKNPVNSEDIKHIFDRFYRGDSSRNSDITGHGIGLSSAKAIVEAHNGKIKAEAKSKNSFIITVQLPT